MREAGRPTSPDVRRSLSPALSRIEGLVKAKSRLGFEPKAPPEPEGGNDASDSDSAVDESYLSGSLNGSFKRGLHDSFKTATHIEADSIM